MRRNRGNRVLASLAAICFVLAGLLYLELTRRPEGIVVVPTQPERMPLPSTQDRQSDTAALVPPIESFSNILERPLFWASRRPPTDFPSAPKGDAAVVDFVLHGIVITSDERFAMFQQGSPSRLIRLNEGQELQGWTVRSILGDRVLLRNNDRLLELRFVDRAPARDQSGASAAPAPDRVSPSRPVR